MWSIVNESINKVFLELGEEKNNYKVDKEIIKDNGDILLTLINKKTNKCWENKISREYFFKAGFLEELDRLLKGAIRNIKV